MHTAVYSRIGTVAESFPSAGSVISRTSSWVLVHWGSWWLWFMEAIQVESCVPWQLPQAQQHTVTVGWFEQLLSWAVGKCCIYIAALFSLEGPSQEHKLVFLDMTMVAEDRFSLLHTSQAVGMSVAGQLSKPKMLELRQVWERVTALIDDSKQCLD